MFYTFLYQMVKSWLAQTYKSELPIHFAAQDMELSLQCRTIKIAKTT